MPSFDLQLQRQLRFIESSSLAYDRGQTEEALRIAVSLRVLFHDTKLSTSLLTHLGIKTSAQILTTIEPSHVVDPITGWIRGTLALWVTPDGTKPPLDRAQRKDFVPAGDWWNQYVLDREQPLSRKDIVLAASNEDGGAHVDRDPGDKTLILIKGFGRVCSADGVERELDNQHFPLLRQFAYEVLNSPSLRPSTGT